MKTFITSLLLMSFLAVYSQDVSVGTKFFTSQGMKVALSIGADVTWAGENGKTGLINEFGTISNDNIYFSKYPNTNYNFGVDIYSSLSKLGFYIEAGINKQEYTIISEDNIRIDSIVNTNIEIPAYLKFRFGKLESKSHMWLALGAGYSYVSKSKTIIKDDFNVIEIDSKNNFKPSYFLSSIVGYELIIPFANSQGRPIYDRDNFRMLFYAKANYDMSNRFNSSTDVFYQNQELKFFRLSFGIKIIMRISKFAEVVNESLKESLKK